MNFKPPDTTSYSSSVAAEKAFSFISKGWREVKDSADADLQLMKDRANRFKNIASSFDREFENFINSASKSSFSVPAIGASTPAEIDFVRRLQPKLTEFRRAYSSPDFSKRVLEKWSPGARLRIDLSAIRKAIESEVVDDDVDFRRRKRGSYKLDLKKEEDEVKDWEPIKAFKTRFKSSPDFFESFKNSEFVDKVKTTLVCSFC